MTCPNPPRPGDPISATLMTDLVNYVRSITPCEGPGIKLRRSSSGTHFSAKVTGIKAVEGTIETGPFKFRYVETDASAGIPYTGWEIYLPTGCVNVNAACEPINIPAQRRNSSGTLVNLDDWYRMPFPSGTPQAGDIWKVTVHAKVSNGIYGVDQLANWNRKFIFAEIHKTSRTSAELAADMSSCGDDFSADVGQVKFVASEDNNAVIEKQITRTINRPITTTVSRNQGFELQWGFTVNSNTLRLAVNKIVLTNNTFSAAGATYSGSTKTDIPLATRAIYLKISAATSPYIGTIRTFTAENAGSSDMQISQQAAADKGPLDIMVRLYMLDNCRIDQDNRNNANNIQLYMA